MSENLLPLFWFIHDLDEPFVFIFLIAFLSLFLGLYRRSHALGFFVSVALTFITINVLKHLFAIPRPEFMVLATDGYRFPSMHAAITGAITGSLWFFALQYFKNPYMRALATLILASILAVVCISRVALNVHEPIDVIVGGAIGVGFAYFVNRFVDSQTTHS